MQQSAPIEVGITVNDIQTMTAFYQQVFNCTEDHRADIPASLSSSLGIAKRGYLCVWLTTPNNERIKLMAPPAPPKPEPDDDFFTTRCGFAYLTFYCRDLRSTLAKAQALGAILRSQPDLAAPEQDVQICFFQDPESNVIELVETPTGERV